MVCTVPYLSEQEVRFCSEIKMCLLGDMAPLIATRRQRGRAVHSRVTLSSNDLEGGGDQGRVARLRPGNYRWRAHARARATALA